ncbi:MAG: Tetrahydromethanopterin S-methyltransferase [Sedimentibacter sp.]|nr:Tetrahydromethanopterin S-methyltransferase [Sedimentibacter sp.]
MVTNTFDKVFSDLKNFHSIESNFSNHGIYELPAAGEYHVLSLDSTSSVAVSTLSSSKLSEELAGLKPRGLSIVGKTETENIGVEKIIKNVLAVPSIKYLILCGKDSQGHYSGNTLLKLFENGVDQNKKVIDSKGRKSVLINTLQEEIELFRKNISVIDMIDCENINEILDKIEELREKDSKIHENITAKYDKNYNLNITSIETVTATEKNPYNVRLDKEGYFVIIPEYNKKIIIVEHYSNIHKLLHIIQGDNARNIYWAIIENNWVSEMSHAAYLGKELTLAELSIISGNKYVQDKA